MRRVILITLAAATLAATGWAARGAATEPTRPDPGACYFAGDPREATVDTRWRGKLGAPQIRETASAINA